MKEKQQKNKTAKQTNGNIGTYKLNIRILSILLIINASSVTYVFN